MRLKKFGIFILVLIILEGIAYGTVYYYNSSYYFQKKYMMLNKIKGKKISAYNSKTDYFRMQEYKLKIKNINKLKNKKDWQQFESYNYTIFNEIDTNEVAKLKLPESGYYILFDRKDKKMKTFSECNIIGSYSYILAIIDFEKELLYVLDIYFS